MVEARQLRPVERFPTRLRALIVTEDERLGGTLARVLERRGALRVKKTTPAVAIAQARIEGVDVVLLDLAAGVAFDGELSARLGEYAPVILLCSYLTQSERERVRASGVAAIHLKHIGVEDLRRRIHTVCGTA